MTNKLLALLLPAALTIAQIAEAKKPRQIPDWYPDKDSLYRAVESIPPFGIYKDNYIVTGTSFSGGRVTKDNSDAKFQISLRHRLIKSILPLHTYLFLTYTQKSFWEIYKDSKPFYENNYNPTLGFGMPITRGAAGTESPFRRFTRSIRISRYRPNSGSRSRCRTIRTSSATPATDRSPEPIRPVTSGFAFRCSSLNGAAGI